MAKSKPQSVAKTEPKVISARVERIVNRLFDEGIGQHELQIKWLPAHRSVTVGLIRVERVQQGARNVPYAQSPAVYHALPDPDGNGELEVQFALRADAPLDTLALAVVNSKTSARAIVQVFTNVNNGDTPHNTVTVVAP